MLELRLDKKQHKAASTSAELLLAAYRRWDLDAATHLVGDFAFAIGVFLIWTTFGTLNFHDTFTAGGLVDDVDVTIKKARFVEWDYGGTIPKPSLAACFEMEDDEGNEHIQYFSGGDLKNWTPSEDGKRLDRAGSATTLNDNSNLSQLITSIINAGFPENKLDEDISIFEDMYCHVLRKAQPKRTGLIQPEEGERARTVLLVTEIHKMPWEKKGKKTTTKTKTKAKAKPAEDEEEEGGDDLSAKATEAVLEALIEADGGPISKVDLSKAVFKKLTKDPDRNKVVQLVHDQEFLTEGDWKYDGAKISLE